MDRRSFEKLVAQALAELPAAFRQRLTNVAIIVEDKPSKEDLEEAGIPQGEMLLGLYVGTPLTERGSSYGLVLPDTIIVFQRPIEAICHNRQEIKEEVKRTVIHEVAHYFGISDEALEEYEG